jgi:hypothetical protein
MDAAEAAPEAASVTQPKEALPAVNVTVPVGAAVPLAGFTATVNTVEAVCAMLAGPAEVETEVEISGALTVTAIGVDTDAMKLPAPA